MQLNILKTELKNYDKENYQKVTGKCAKMTQHETPECSEILDIKLEFHEQQKTCEQQKNQFK